MTLRSLIKWLLCVSNANWHRGRRWVWVPAALPWKDQLGYGLTAASKCLDPHPDHGPAITPGHSQSLGCPAATSSSDTCQLMTRGHGLSRILKPAEVISIPMCWGANPLLSKHRPWFPNASRWVTVNIWDISKEVLTLGIYSHMLPWIYQILDLHC